MSELPAIVSSSHTILHTALSSSPNHIFHGLIQIANTTPPSSGHTAVRCKEPAAGDNGDGADAGGDYGGGSGGGMNTAMAGGGDFPTGGGGGDSFANAGGDDGW